jgi:CRP-like cAMP-binding protein
LVNQLKKNITKYAHLTDEQWDDFISLFYHKTISKKDYLLTFGQHCQFEAYIIKGCFRTYFTDTDNKDVILSFAFEDWWMGDMFSQLNKLPSKMYIQALEDSEVLIIKTQDKEELYKKHPVFERIFRIMVMRHLVSYQDRLYKIYGLNAQERYHDLVLKYPQLLQRISLKHIASYIGVTPEFLSKMRKDSLK